MGALCSFSIDDGHPSDMRVAALLDKHGLAGTFYLPISNVEGWPVMDAARMRELAGRFEVGSHTLEHRYLSSLPAAQARIQIVQGRHALEQILGEAVDGFCYPGGRFRAEHVAQVRAAGFRYARSTVNLHFDCGRQLFEMPTTLQFYPHRPAVYLRNFVSGGAWRQRRRALWLALRHPDWLARLYALFDDACERDAVFHMWMHSADVEQLQAWSALDGFLGHIASRTAPHARRTNRQLLGA